MSGLLRGKFPTASLKMGRTALPGHAVTGTNATALEHHLHTLSQGSLKTASTNIILDSKILSVFFEKIAANILSQGVSMVKSITSNVATSQLRSPAQQALSSAFKNVKPAIKLPGSYISYKNPGGLSRTTIQTPIPRS